MVHTPLFRNDFYLGNPSWLGGSCASSLSWGDLIVSSVGVRGRGNSGEACAGGDQDDYRKAHSGTLHLYVHNIFL